MIAFAALSVIRVPRSRVVSLGIGLLLALVIAVTLGASPSHAEAFSAPSDVTAAEAAGASANGDITSPESSGCACACVAHATGALPSTLADPAPTMLAVTWPPACSTFRPGGEVPLQERPPRI
ncbi:MAG: hypothetical protein U1E50_16195 [Caulobacteraceae bacterium]